MIEIAAYHPDSRQSWDQIAGEADNGHFMFKRSYMDYHADRFVDASFVVLNKGRAIGIVPGNDGRNDDQKIWRSHSGLTFGGLMVKPKFNRIKVIEEVYGLLFDALRDRGYDRAQIKPVPWIYQQVPTEGQIYFLNRQGKADCAVEISTTVDLRNTPKASSSREWMDRKAKSAGFYVEESDDFDGFWAVLSGRLEDKYDRRPVHSVDEIKLLAERFPKNIRLFVVRDAKRNVVGGTVMFLTSQVAHTQYLAASETGMVDGALDILIFHLIALYRDQGMRYFDFGISNEQDGMILNSSLAAFKEGFGGRSIIHHKFSFDL